MQSIIPETLLSLQHDPHGLETTYREQPDAFARALSEFGATIPFAAG